MTDKTRHIPIDSPKEEFKNHLAIPDNHRVFFSGPFGIGKTYFIKKFFEESEEYISIHLYPVNYSVAQNEDIFELIKYDIIRNLIESKVEVFDNIEISNSIYFYFYFQNSVNRILEPFIEGTKKLSSSADGLLKFANGLEKVEKLNLNGFEKFKKENSSKLSILQKYLGESEESKGSIYESNYYTALIKSAIDVLREKDKKIVLVIDDLDRVDPEHIFRILNVFSAHFDQYDFERNEDVHRNKFGFDTVMLVGDYQNIQSIFSHKYGVKADFNGYLDKFYSQALFQYDNLDAIKLWVDSLDFPGLDFLRVSIIRIVKELLNDRCITVRGLMRYQPVRINKPTGKFIFAKLYILLCDLLGGFEVLKNTFLIMKSQEKKLFDPNFETEEIDQLLTVALPIIKEFGVLLKTYTDNKYTIELSSYKTVVFSLKEVSGNTYAKIDNHEIVSSDLFWEILLEGLESSRLYFISRIGI